MKTKPILKAVVLGGGLALVANPVWAGAGSYGHDSNRAAQERNEGSGPIGNGSLSSRVGAMDQDKTREVQQALKEHGFQAGSEGMMDAQTREAIAQFQRHNNIPATGTVDEQTAEKLGVEISAAPQGQPHDGEAHPETRPGAGQFMEQG